LKHPQNGGFEAGNAQQDNLLRPADTDTDNELSDELLRADAANRDTSL
jgi:hypothetical protein